MTDHAVAGNGWLTVPAPAKLNLFLHITGRRDDGYHNLQTIFQFLDHSDELSFRVREDNAITLSPAIEASMISHKASTHGWKR